MKYYDKYGNPHSSMLRAFIANRTSKPEIANAFKGAVEAAEHQLNRVIPYEEITDKKIEEILSSMNDQMREPIEAFVKGELNSDVGEKKLIEVICGVLANSIKENPAIYTRAADRIIPRFGNNLRTMIGIQGTIQDINHQNG